jgi:hypothetical protein
MKLSERNQRAAEDVAVFWLKSAERFGKEGRKAFPLSKFDRFQFQNIIGRCLTDRLFDGMKVAALSYAKHLLKYRPEIYPHVIAMFSQNSPGSVRFIGAERAGLIAEKAVEGAVR